MNDLNTCDQAHSLDSLTFRPRSLVDMVVFFYPSLLIPFQ